MKRISIIYFSGTGTTAKFAESIQEGASSVVDIEANLISIEGKDIEMGRYENEVVMSQLDESNTIILVHQHMCELPQGSLRLLPMHQLEVGRSKNGETKLLLALPLRVHPVAIN